MKLEITGFRATDREALQKIFYSERLSAFWWADKSRFQLTDFENETEGEDILVAVSGENRIGFISIFAPDHFIHHLYVDKKFQNQKVGTRLLKAVIDKYHLPIRLKCIENNHKAVSFYKKRGFIEVEKGQSDLGTYILFEIRDTLEA